MLQPFNKSLPLLGDAPVNIKIGSREFTFRRKTWLDEMEIDKLHAGGDLRVTILAYCLTAIAGKPVTRYEDKLTICRAIAARPAVFNRVYIVVFGSMPARRTFSLEEPPYTAPSTREFLRVISEDEEQTDQLADKALGTPEADPDQIATEAAVANAARVSQRSSTSQNNFKPAASVDSSHPVKVSPFEGGD